jgi:hypothetical protein
MSLTTFSRIESVYTSTIRDDTKRQWETESLLRMYSRLLRQNSKVRKKKNRKTLILTPQRKRMSQKSKSKERRKRESQQSLLFPCSYWKMAISRQPLTSFSLHYQCRTKVSLDQRF